MMMFNVKSFNVSRKAAKNSRLKASGLLIWNQKPTGLRSVFDAVFYSATPPFRFAVGFVVSRSRINPDFRFQRQAENFFKIYRATGEAAAFELPRTPRSGKTPSRRGLIFL